MFNRSKLLPWSSFAGGNGSSHDHFTDSQAVLCSASTAGGSRTGVDKASSQAPTSKTMQFPTRETREVYCAGVPLISVYALEAVDSWRPLHDPASSGHFRRGVQSQTNPPKVKPGLAWPLNVDFIKQCCSGYLMVTSSPRASENGEVYPMALRVSQNPV